MSGNSHTFLTRHPRNPFHEPCIPHHHLRAPFHHLREGGGLARARMACTFIKAAFAAARMPAFAGMAIIFLLSLSTPSLAAELLFREDSGLTKTEYLLSVSQWTAAIDTANGVLKRHPNNADAYTYRGYAYYRLGETAQATKNFQSALQLNPTHLGANKYLADVYLDQGDVSRALEQLQVIRMTCGSMDCEELNSLERAIDQYKKADKPAEKNK